MTRERDEWPDTIPNPADHLSPLTASSLPPQNPSRTDTLTFTIETPHHLQTTLETLYPEYIDHGYALNGYQTTTGETKLVAKPLAEPAGNIPAAMLLFAITVVSTLYAGTTWYHTGTSLQELTTALPFMISVMGVLTIHELGHYLASRHYDVRTSPPYFLPVPTLLGTLGAVIRIDGRIPSRKARFDIGAAGPLAGLIAAITTIAIGLHYPFVEAITLHTGPHTVQTLQLGYPPLMHAISFLTGQPLPTDPTVMVNPIVIGGWVGLLITFLNLLPVGELDGGHILHAMIGRQSEPVESAIPIALIALAAYTYSILDAGVNSVLIWIAWAVLTTIFLSGTTHDTIDRSPLDDRRRLLGVFTFTAGLLCFTPTPVLLV